MINDLIIFNTKKGKRNKRNESGIYISIIKNTLGMARIKLYIDIKLAEEYGLSENNKLKLGCRKNDLYIWAIIVSNDGYAVYSNPNKTTFTCSLPYPFVWNENKRLQFVPHDDITRDDVNNIMMVSVKNIFKDETLQIQ